MKHLVRNTLLMTSIFVCTALGLAQDTNSTPQTSDKQAQKQAARERQEAERKKRKAEEEEARRLQEQAGVRCARLRGKHKQ